LEKQELEFTYRPIGVIHTPFKRCGDAPAQGCFSRESRGEVEVFPEYEPGLQDIAGFSHLILLYHFHQAEGYDLLAKPLLDKEKRGVFATRYFKRPNSIGLSIVRLLGVRGNRLDVGWVDMLDGTPLLDIKPYVSLFDTREDVVDGWFCQASELKSGLPSPSPGPHGARIERI
jgi:tRNA-Thr(GGU) m(6)t(6)A37 methyltransferase TsaA